MIGASKYKKLGYELVPKNELATHKAKISPLDGLHPIVLRETKLVSNGDGEQEQSQKCIVCDRSNPMHGLVMWKKFDQIYNLQK